MKVTKVCGNKDCAMSTFIDEETLTFGRGELHSHGDWEIPCNQCARAWKEAHPNDKVMIVKEEESE